MAALAYKPAVAACCLLLVALTVVSTGEARVPVPAPAPAPKEEDPCSHIKCPLDGFPQDAFLATKMCPGEDGREVCCCCPRGYANGCCPAFYCNRAPSPTAALA